MRANANKKKAVNYIAIITAVVLATYAITMIVPILWTLMTTVKKPLEYGAGENVDICKEVDINGEKVTLSLAKTSN